MKTKKNLVAAWSFYFLGIYGCSTIEKMPVHQLSEAKFISEDSVVFKRTKYDFYKESGFASGSWIKNEKQTLEIVNIRTGVSTILDSSAGRHISFQLVGVSESEITYLCSPETLAWSINLKDGVKASKSLRKGYFDGIADSGESLIIEKIIVRLENDSIIKVAAKTNRNFGILYESTKHNYAISGDYEGSVEIFANERYSTVTKLDKGVYLMPWGSALLSNVSKSIIVRGIKNYVYVDIDSGMNVGAYKLASNIGDGYLIADILRDVNKTIYEDDVDLDESSRPLKVLENSELVYEIK